MCPKTGNTAYVFNEAFSKLDKQSSTVFDTNPETILNNEGRLKFNGASVTRTMKTLHLSQPGRIKNLQQLYVNHATLADYVAEGACGAYIAAICGPDARYSFNNYS